jgi:hypothetical protein
LGVGAQGYQPCLYKKFNRYRNLNNCKVVEALYSSRERRGLVVIVAAAVVVVVVVVFN